jgi:DNA/RNA-binding domain of Phe-tRNA-synthetase-like protein
MPEPPLEQGWIAPELAQDFPELGLAYLTLDARHHRTPEPVRRRLRRLADRITGGHVVHMRQDTVPWAYRVFWRQVGIDPDTDRTPVERMAVERLRHGGLRSTNLLEDAITIATLETGVAISAFDADRVAGALGVRVAAEGEPLGGAGRPLPGGRIVLADEERALAVLGGEVAEDREVTRATTRVSMAAIEVKGVPRISVEEALWTVLDLLSEER